MPPDQRKAHARKLAVTVVDQPERDRQAWRDMLRDTAGLSFADFDALLRDSRAALRDAADGLALPPGSRLVPGSAGWAYVPGGGPVWKISRDDMVKVLDWSPVVSEILVPVDDDGKPSGRRYVLTVGRDTATVAYPVVRDGTVWDTFPDAYGVGAKSVREVLANILTDQARHLDRLAVVDRIGGHTVNGSRVYVRPDGRTVPAGVPVRLDGISAELAHAAAPVERDATPAELVAAITEVRGRGWSPLLALGIGARAAGWSMCPVLCGCIAAGDPGAGKSLTQGMARWLFIDNTWPPLATVSFNDTLTNIEFALAAESDFPANMEDLALTGNASTFEVKEATKKLDTIFRSLANGTEVRGRRNRDLTKRPGNRIRTIVAANMQRLPADMQESLYRRTVVLYVERGDVDIRWYAKESREVLRLPLRTIGDRVLARLWGGDAAEARRVLDQADAAGVHMLSTAMDRLAPGWADSADQFAGVVRSAGAYLGGLALVAEAAGVDFEWLAAPVVEPLARSLVRQWDAMRDARAGSDDVAVAVGELVRDALLHRRAHVRDQADNVVPCVPGQTVQAHGLREVPGNAYAGRPDGWDGQGAALYWLPEHGGVGVHSKELHTLVGRDPRIGGTAATLPATLLRGGASLPSGQGDSPYVKQVWVSGTRHRFVILRPELIWDLPEADPPAPPAELTPVAPDPEPAPVDRAAADLAADQAAAGGQCPACHAAGPWCGPSGRDWPAPVPCVACGQDTTTESACGQMRHPLCGPAGPAETAVAAPAAPAAPTGHPRPQRGAQRLTAPAQRRPVDPPAPAVIVPTAAEVEHFTRAVHRDDRPDPTEAEAAAGLAAFHAATDGLRFVSYPGEVGVALYARLVARHGSTPSPAPYRSELVDNITTGGRFRRLLDYTNPHRVPAEGQWLVGVDVNAQFPAAAQTVALGHGEPTHYADGIDPAALADFKYPPGYVKLARAPRFKALQRKGFALPFADLAAGDWLAVPHVAYLAGRGVELVTDEALIWHDNRRWLGLWSRRVLDARATLMRQVDPDTGKMTPPAALALAALKAVYGAFLGGMIRSERFNHTGTMRRDWSDQMRALGQVNALRQLDRVTYRVPLSTTDPELAAAIRDGAKPAGPTPVGMCLDTAWYAASSADDLPPRDRLDTASGRAGKWKVDKVVPVTEAITEAYATGSPYTLRDVINDQARGVA